MLGRVRPLHVGTALLRKARAGAVQQHRRRVAEWTSALVRPMSTGFGGLQYDTLVEMQERACERYADKNFLGYRGTESGPFKYVTYKEFGRMVNQTRVAFKQAGIGKGDKVAVISSNRVEWAVSAYSAFSLGAVCVPMYEQQRTKECEYILSDSGAKLLLVSKERIYDKTRDFVGKLPALKEVWCFDLDFESRLKVIDAHSFEASEAVAPDDVATLIYTSGTTGVPKGVQLTHRNLTSDVKGMGVVIPDDAIPVPRSVSFLPWAHVFGKTCELHNGLQRGSCIAIAQDLTTLPNDLLEAKPTMLYSVPTLFKRVYDRIQDKIRNETPRTKALIAKALQVGEARRKLIMAGEEPGFWLKLQHRVLDKLVLQKLRAPFGGELTSAYVGGSAMPVEVANFFENVGIAICEGYGLTETSPLICVNPFNTHIRRIGTVGQLIEEADVRIVMDGSEVAFGLEGEIWVHGPFVFPGYHNKPNETQEAFADLQGRKYFRTGDLGMMTQGGGGVPLLKITGRMKELYKLENGKYVAPALIEKALHECELFTQILVYGSDQPFNVALVVPNWDKLTAWAIEHADGISAISSKKEVGEHPKVQAYIDNEVITICKEKVKKYEIPNKVLLIEEAFSVDNEMLTQKLSIKRHMVLKKYKPQVDALYKSGPDSKVLVA